MQYLVRRIGRVNVSAEIMDWPELLSKTGDDPPQIATPETELMTISLKRPLESEADIIVARNADASVHFCGSGGCCF